MTGSTCEGRMMSQGHCDSRRSRFPLQDVDGSVDLTMSIHLAILWGNLQPVWEGCATIFWNSWHSIYLTTEKPYSVHQACDSPTYIRDDAPSSPPLCRARNSPCKNTCALVDWIYHFSMTHCLTGLDFSHSVPEQDNNLPYRDRTLFFSPSGNHLQHQVREHITWIRNFNCWPPHG